MPKCCCVYSQMFRWGAVCMTAYLYICYLSSATDLLEMLWLTLWDEDHILILENCFFDCMIKERCQLNGAVDLSRWGGMIGCLQLVYIAPQDQWPLCPMYRKREDCKLLLMDLLSYWRSWMLQWNVTRLCQNPADAIAHRYQITIM